MSLNKVLLIGHVGKKPEIKNIDFDKKVCNFSLATSKRSKDKNRQENNITEWHHIVVFDKLAEISAKYINKGSHIYLEGCLQYKKYVGKDGIEKNITQIIASSIEFLSKSKDEKTNDNNNGNIEDSYYNKHTDDDLPF